ncbi:hypothetical protein H9L12_00155 [Sphingomonas rhizophila]|uniref:Uncharacterized protein n=1 Tax=Sphingomonas rhizophila TaxID=2071607 RepID=A0A7G9SB94_9SPHN|nr:hypothetical protein [Sphingomonas rhizophila]QNN65119.1 hypothetical protein H9L12_00155 [Sphingomonas rhizophila]
MRGRGDEQRIDGVALGNHEGQRLAIFGDGEVICEAGQLRRHLGVDDGAILAAQEIVTALAGGGSPDGQRGGASAAVERRTCQITSSVS